MVDSFFIFLTLLHTVFAVVTQDSKCFTSKNDDGGKAARNYGQLDTLCQFPFILNNKTYRSCTYDYSHVTAYKPWCSTKTDDKNNHDKGRIKINGKTKKNWGVCDDTENCNIQPRWCGEPYDTRPPPDDGIDADVSIRQVPWLTSLGGFKTRTKWDHQCGGSLVTNKHVLTAAHCLNITFIKEQEYIGGLLEIGGLEMRFGTADLWNTNVGTSRIISKIYKHPLYTPGRAYFDVGVVEAQKILEFTNYVMPICLPMRPIDDEDALEGDYVNLAGWGLQWDSDNQKYQLDSTMKLINLQVHSKEECEDDYFSPDAARDAGMKPNDLRKQIPQNFTSDITCVGNDFDLKSGQCDGDAGSPVTRRISGTARGKPYYEQQFVVSTGIDCKLKATIYTRVSNRQVLTWIQKVTETTPLIMVVGGFASFNKDRLGRVKQPKSNKPTFEIELISQKNSKSCSKAVKGYKGRGFAVEGIKENEGDSFGMTGQFVKEAMIFCGGKNANDNLRTCFEWDASDNTWFPTATLTNERYYGSSVLTPDGDLWVLGGTHASKTADSTEVLEYKPRDESAEPKGRFRKGFPLPTELRDTGIQSQCTVRINSTHVFMAGGYAEAYKVTDALIRTDTEEDADLDIANLGSSKGTVIRGTKSGLPRCNSEEHRNIGLTKPCGKDDEVNAGGKTLDKAWMYDGNQWNDLKPMSITRDRPACSLAQFDDGSIKIIVAGGCLKACFENPPLASAEMYDPKSDKWEKLPDLPFPLNGAKMELLDGIPTIFGGFDGVTQNGLLIQYHDRLKEWIPHPTIRMRIPRSSAAVFQVPRHFFPKQCS